ncbi:TVB4 protein, partial [Podargus strigoides]|nr:TVB4 protein [Podargus strigoides]
GGDTAEGPRIHQTPQHLWVLPGGTAELRCHPPDHGRVNWYKQNPNGSLNWVHWSWRWPQQDGRHSGTWDPSGSFSLVISPARREDTGVYYCSSSSFYFGNGTRLVVTNATEPTLSILVPVDRGEPSATIPLLCHLRDVPQGWDTVVWEPGGEVTAVTMAAVDESGVLGAWSIAWVSAERW